MFQLLVTASEMKAARESMAAIDWAGALFNTEGVSPNNPRNSNTSPGK